MTTDQELPAPLGPVPSDPAATSDAPAETPVPSPGPQETPPEDEPSSPAAHQTAPGRPRRRVLADLGHPFVWGLLATLGGLTAWVLGGALVALGTVLVYIGVAVFLALALDPLVRWLESKGMSRGLSITVVFVAVVVVVGGLLAIVLPVAVEQVSAFAAAVPDYITAIRDSAWFNSLLAAVGTESLVAELLERVRAFLSNPSNLLAIGGGVFAVGSGIVSAFTGGMMVLILTLYFLATLHGMHEGLYRLAPAYARTRVAALTRQVTESVGSYVAGMALLAFCNAVFSFILLSLLGVPFALLLAVLALFITIIPMIGSVLFWIVTSVIAFLSSWWVGLVFVIVYFAYMQVEAYLLTPRVMSKQIRIPGSLVIISALVGGTLAGLLGVLVSVPIAAALLLLVEQLFIPKQDAKVIAPEDSMLG